MQLPTQLETRHTNLKKLKEKLREKLLRKMWRANIMKVITPYHMSIFIEAVVATQFPYNFKMPSFKPFNKQGDSIMHVEVFNARMDFEKLSKFARCHAFPLTPSRLAQSWYNKFPICYNRLPTGYTFSFK